MLIFENEKHARNSDRQQKALNELSADAPLRNNNQDFFLKRQEEGDTSQKKVHAYPYWKFALINSPQPWSIAWLNGFIATRLLYEKKNISEGSSSVWSGWNRCRYRINHHRKITQLLLFRARKWPFWWFEFLQPRRSSAKEHDWVF